jgi:hypothetical protein
MGSEPEGRQGNLMMMHLQGSERHDIWLVQTLSVQFFSRSVALGTQAFIGFLSARDVWGAFSDEGLGSHRPNLIGGVNLESLTRREIPILR